MIVAAARACLGTPFLHQGRRPGLGLDCAGLVVHALRGAGRDVPDVAGYSRLPHGGLLRQACDSAGLVRVARDPRPGDVLLMRFGREPQHLAIATDCGMIHAYERAGRVVEHRISPVWAARIVAVYSCE